MQSSFSIPNRVPAPQWTLQSTSLTGSSETRVAWLRRLRLQLLASALPYMLGHLLAGGWLKMNNLTWAARAPEVFFLLGPVLLAWAASSVDTELRKSPSVIPPQSAVYMAEGALLALTPLFWLALRFA